MRPIRNYLIRIAVYYVYYLRFANLIRYNLIDIYMRADHRYGYNAIIVLAFYPLIECNVGRTHVM
jgi:hypothetical protein